MPLHPDPKYPSKRRLHRRWARLATVLVATVPCSANGHPEIGQPAIGQSATGQLATPNDAVEPITWQPGWRRSNWLDLSLTATGFVTATALELLPRRDEPDWQKPILFDNSLRSSLVAATQAGRNRADLVSDLGLWFSVGQVVLDATLVTMVAHRAPDVGYEMLLMDAEAYAVSVLLNSLTKRISTRARPDADECQKDSQYDQHCTSSHPNSSFYSGHAAVSATSAGLLCAHHQKLALYGGPWDAVACGAGLVLTSFTGALRVVADRHWASDVIVGHLIGFSSGYFIPTLFHYRTTPTRTAGPKINGLLPSITEGGGGIVVFGAL